MESCAAKCGGKIMVWVPILPLLLILIEIQLSISLWSSGILLNNHVLHISLSCWVGKMLGNCLPHIVKHHISPTSLIGTCHSPLFTNCGS